MKIDSASVLLDSSQDVYKRQTVTGEPFRYARERPVQSTTRRSNNPSSTSISCPRSQSVAAGDPRRSNSALTSARSLPTRIKPLSERSPRANASASTRIDLPAPVSPVSAPNPGLNSSSRRSTSTKSRIVNRCSMGGQRASEWPIALLASRSNAASGEAWRNSCNRVVEVGGSKIPSE